MKMIDYENLKEKITKKCEKVYNNKYKKNFKIKLLFEMKKPVFR